MRRILLIFGMLAVTTAQSQQIGNGVGVLKTGLDANTTAEMPSGFYSVTNGTNFPASTFNWHHFVAFDHVYGDGYQLQLSSPYTDPKNTLYFRTVVGGVNQTWQRVATENSNTFKDAQYFPGTGVWNATGKVGIGTTTPNVALVVVDPAQSADIYAGLRFIPAINAGQASEISAFRNAGLRLSGGGGTISGANTFSSDIFLNDIGISFRTGTAITAATEKMIIKNNGYVGIGNNAPASLLNVGTNTATAGPVSKVAMFGGIQAAGEVMALSLVNSAAASNANSVSIGFHNANNYSATGKIQVTQANLSDPTLSKMNFQTYGASGIVNVPAIGLYTRMTIDNDGKVGIGTSNPQSLVHIVDPTQNRIDMHAGLRFIPATTATGPNRVLGFRNGGLVLSGGVTGNETSAEIFLNNTGISFNTGDAYLATTSKMMIQNNGNVAIGTTTVPDGYRLAVNGGIACTKVVVKTNTDWGWPDYVFAKDYKLRPLAEVASFVDENKHLPDVPKAADITENGVDLGQMDAVLLRKVEELTLYILEQEKRIAQLEAQAQAQPQRGWKK